LLTYLGKTKADDEPLPYYVIVESNGVGEAVRSCQTEPQYAREWRLLAVRWARSVQHLLTDKRSLDAISVAEKYANGEATEEELTIARDSAWEAVQGSSRVATKHAACVAWDATSFYAWDGVNASAWDVAYASAWHTAGVASVWSVAHQTAWSDAWKVIEADFLDTVGRGINDGT